MEFLLDKILLTGNPYYIVLFLVFFYIISSLRPLIVDFFASIPNLIRAKKASNELTSNEESDSIKRAIRLEFELAAAHRNIHRLASKGNRVIKYVRDKDPSILFILEDFENEINALDISGDLDEHH